MKSRSCQPFALTCLCLMVEATLAQDTRVAYRSHHPMRPLPAAAKGNMVQGPKLFVDTARGDDGAEGTQQGPWKTLGHALRRLKPGDTLYLRGGTYYEKVSLSRSGTEQAPITIQSYPGELAVLDGGLREFIGEPGHELATAGRGRRRGVRLDQSVSRDRRSAGAATVPAGGLGADVGHRRGAAAGTGALRRLDGAAARLSPAGGPALQQRAVAGGQERNAGFGPLLRSRTVVQSRDGADSHPPGASQARRAWRERLSRRNRSAQSCR